MDALGIAVQAVTTMFGKGKPPPDTTINISYLVLKTTKGPHYQITAAYGPTEKEKKS